MTVKKRTKKARASSIAKAAAARDAAGTTPTARGDYTFWITRDSALGVPAPVVKVWLRRPSRAVDKHGAAWFAAREDGVAALYAEWAPEHARKIVGTLPDDDYQCIRKDGKAGVAEADAELAAA